VKTFSVECHFSSPH